MNRMKTVAGMGSLDDYDGYVSAGADEVFAGFVPQSWAENFGPTVPLNRREVCFYNVQLGSWSELEILSGKVSETGIPVTLCFNSLTFREEHYIPIEKIMEGCIDLGFRSFIVADMGFLLHLSSCGITRKAHIHLSGEYGEINHVILRELTKLGIRRLIFHRKVRVSDMASIIEAQRSFEKEQCLPPIEFEAFLLNENCHFCGGYCNTLHTDDLVPMCRMPYVLKDISSPDTHPENQACSISADEDPYLTSEDFGYDYGLMHLSEMQKAGITHLKIVGRGADHEFMERSIKRQKSILSVFRTI